MKLRMRPLQFSRLLISCHALWSNSVIPRITHLLGLCTCPKLEQKISCFSSAFKFLTFYFSLMITHFRRPAERVGAFVEIWLFNSRVRSDINTSVLAVLYPYQMFKKKYRFVSLWQRQGWHIQIMFPLEFPAQQRQQAIHSQNDIVWHLKLKSSVILPLTVVANSCIFITS